MNQLLDRVGKVEERLPEARLRELFDEGEDGAEPAGRARSARLRGPRPAEGRERAGVAGAVPW